MALSEVRDATPCIRNPTNGSYELLLRRLRIAWVNEGPKTPSLDRGMMRIKNAVKSVTTENAYHCKQEQQLECAVQIRIGVIHPLDLAFN